jgi:Rhs element Vgr protein
MSTANSRSQDLSTFKIYSAGNEITENINVAAIIVERSLNHIPTAKIIIRDGDAAKGDFPASNKQELNPGELIRIDAGFHNHNKTIFEGVIIKQNIQLKNGKDSLLVIDCKDKVFQMTFGRKSKYFIDSTDSSAVESIISTYGFKKSIAKTSVNHKQLIQYKCTDWDFIISRLEINNSVVSVENGNIISRYPEIKSTADVQATFGSEIIHLDANLDASNQYKTVKCKAWDTGDQDLVIEENEAITLSDTGDLTSSTLSGKVNNPSIEYTHSGKLSANELKSWATSQQTKNFLSKIKGTVTCIGKLEAKPGNTIELSGCGNHFNGKHFISAVRNDLINNVWETTIQFGLWEELFSEQYRISEPEAAGIISNVSGLQVGKVTQLSNDPESEFRIKIKLPLADNKDDGFWARVATLDAGKERGSFFLPEKDDEVIVGFINNDPRHPVILGMLNSSNKPAPLKSSEKNPEKGFVTRSKMKMIFNDEKITFSLKTPGGYEFLIDEEQKKISLYDSTGNKMEFSSSGIKIESAGSIQLKAKTDLKGEGVNVEMKGTSGFKAEGNGTAKLSSSGATEVKGSIVNIN